MSEERSVKERIDNYEKFGSGPVCVFGVED